MAGDAPLGSDGAAATPPPASGTSAAVSPEAHVPGGPAASHGGFWALTLGAIGVVFGDIGTSPLYTLKEAFSPHYGLDSDHDTVLGVLSLAFWALMVVDMNQSLRSRCGTS